MNCWRCHHQIKPKEPVYRVRTGSGMIEEVCKLCFISTWASTEKVHGPFSCGGCGRPVVLTWAPRNDYGNRAQYIACSYRCRQIIYAAQAKLRRAHSPQPCVVCGESFTPKRTDSLYCSSACRQKAYRRRLNVD